MKLVEEKLRKYVGRKKLQHWGNIVKKIEEGKNN